MSGVLLCMDRPEQQPALAVLGLVTLFSDGFHLPEGGMGKVPRRSAARCSRMAGTSI